MNNGQNNVRSNNIHFQRALEVGILIASLVINLEINPGPFGPLVSKTDKYISSSDHTFDAVLLRVASGLFIS